MGGWIARKCVIILIYTDTRHMYPKKLLLLLVLLIIATIIIMIMNKIVIGLPKIKIHIYIYITKYLPVLT